MSLIEYLKEIYDSKSGTITILEQLNENKLPKRGKPKEKKEGW